MSKKRKVLHKGLALVLAVVMSLGTCLTAFASESNGNNDTKVTIADGETPYISFGADLREDEKAKVLDYFGLEESEKLLFLAIVTGETWKKLRRGLITKMLIDVPGTGVSFIVPLSSVGGRKTLQFLVNEQEFEKEEETSMKDTDYELLVAIANQGYIDTVMDAARSAKAGGGTVIHAKGTGMELAKKYLGVSLVEEKEVILIVTKSREKNQIMKAIMEQAGLDSKERTIVFSLPVTSVAGIRMLEEDIQDDLL